MLAVKFLRQIRVPVTYYFPTRIPPPRFGKWNGFHTLEGIQIQQSHPAPKLLSLQIRHYAHRILRLNLLPIGSMFVCAALGSRSTSLSPPTAYCAAADGSSHSWTNHSQSISSKERLRRIVLLMRKLIVPIFLLLNVWLKWGQINPLFLAARVVLIFFCTKPIPSSVYIFVDQLRNQIMSKQPLLYRFKPLHANKVEVEDYTLVCVAKVHIKDEKLTLIGILGSWWILPLSSGTEVFLFDKLSWKALVSLVNRRFRLAAETTCRNDILQEDAGGDISYVSVIVPEQQDEIWNMYSQYSHGFCARSEVFYH